MNNSHQQHLIKSTFELYYRKKTLVFELAPKGIRINLLPPGMVDTSLIADVSEQK
jgi:hypothetical protein